MTTWPQRLTPFVAWLCCGAALIPADTHVASLGERTMTLAAGGTVLSSATVCPGYAFDTLGPGGPRLSPDLHWVLVDVLGPFLPGDVARTHALIAVDSGAIIMSTDFPEYAGAPATASPLTWASGEREVLRYNDGKTVSLRDGPLKPVPPLQCAPDSPPA